MMSFLEIVAGLWSDLVSRGDERDSQQQRLIDEIRRGELKQYPLLTLLESWPSEGDDAIRTLAWGEFAAIDPELVHRDLLDLDHMFLVFLFSSLAVPGLFTSICGGRTSIQCVLWFNTEYATSILPPDLRMSPSAPLIAGGSFLLPDLSRPAVPCSNAGVEIFDWRSSASA